jgi:transcriptional regulator with XRE-family HTH domain
MEARKRVAVNVQRLRRDRGLSQEELGARARVHQTYLSQVESAKRNPSIDVIERLAAALGVDISVLFQR